MSTIQDLFQQARLAEAAYADLIAAIGSSANLLRALDVKNKDQYDGSFSETQAAAFVEDWEVIDQYTTPQARIVGVSLRTPTFRRDRSGEAPGSETFIFMK
jgi:hypothetical protein